MNSAKVIRTGFSELSRSAANYIDKLRREIRRHDYLYYVKDRPEISDEDYDRLHDTLKRLGKSFGQCHYYTERLVPNETMKADGRIRYVLGSTKSLTGIDVVGVTSRRKLYADV
jgi:hypothetical protein